MVVDTTDFSSDPDDTQVVLQLARIAETAERYEDMCNFMRKLVDLKVNQGQELDVEERNLLSVAYKNVVGSKRASWRTLSAEDSDDQQLSADYQQVVEKELRETCNEVLDLLTNKLLKVAAKQDETLVFYHKMAGDYYRYLAELSTGNGGEDDKRNAEDCYNKAMECAKSCLPETHPTRLGLALNFSVCYYEILKKPTEACALAKEAFDAAIEKLDTLNDASYKDSTLIMQLLRDNLTLWTTETNENDDVQD